MKTILKTYDFFPCLICCSRYGRMLPLSTHNGAHPSTYSPMNPMNFLPVRQLGNILPPYKHLRKPYPFPDLIMTNVCLVLFLLVDLFN